MRQLCRRHVVVLLRAKRLAIDREMATARSAVPEIVLGDRVTKGIARREQARYRKALIVARRDIGSYWRHHRTGINRRGYRDARRPGAPLSTITDPYPQHVRTRAADVRGLRELR